VNTSYEYFGSCFVLGQLFGHTHLEPYTFLWAISTFSSHTLAAYNFKFMFRCPRQFMLCSALQHLTNNLFDFPLMPFAYSHCHGRTLLPAGVPDRRILAKST